MNEAVDLFDLGLDEGGHLILQHALRRTEVGERLAVHGSAPELALHLRAWCRRQGHEVVWPEGESEPVAWVIRGAFDGARRLGAERAGRSAAAIEGAVCDHPPPRWGLGARGALIEAGGPAFDFALSDKAEVWSDDAGRLYEQAAAAQWDPAAAIDWGASFELPDEIEDAVVQIMTYLIENETAALLVPARFLARIHPHFREVMQLLAIQVADEARHIEVFNRRATLKRDVLGLSSAGGQASLKTLIDEPDFALASFLLSVLGEGTFLSLLWFLHEHAPDPITQSVARLAAQDEARHVAFGLAHLSRHCSLDPTMHARLAATVARRHEVLRSTAGLNQDVFDALVLLAAGSLSHGDVRRGFLRVRALESDMHEGRQKRLLRLGFDAAQAQELSSLHTRNFM